MYMTDKSTFDVAVVIPNLNGEAYLGECIDSLLMQSKSCTIIVVDNGSSDSSRSIIKKYGDRVVSIFQNENMGFTGGVNPGIQYAIENNFDSVALINNDARVDSKWLENLLADMSEGIGAVTGSFVLEDGSRYDTTGECFSEWGMGFPRDRGVSTTKKRESGFVFGATGGATLYSISALREVGIFDQNFFAYNEDVDISFRLQLAGWKIRYAPSAIAYHRLSQTTKKMYKGFATYHTFKNLPLVLHKNLPRELRDAVLPRFWLAYWLFFANAILHRNGLAAVKGFLAYRQLRNSYPSKSLRNVGTEYIRSLFSPGPPPGSKGLIKIHSIFKKRVATK
jgi:GT2 family glycosyltransferase